MHLITKNDKQQGRTMAWHGLTDVKPELSLADCWLNEWDYKPTQLKLEMGEKVPLFALRVTDGALNLDGDGNEIAESPLIVGDSFNEGSFKPVTNKKLIELLAKVTEGKDLVLASCGTVKNRGRQFLSFECGESYKAAGREFMPYFNIGNGNDKSSLLWQNTSNICTVCNNTFQMNMLNAGFIMEVKKTRFSDLKIADFSKAAKAILAGQQEFAAMLETLALVKCDETTAREFFAGFIGKPKVALSTKASNNLERLVQLFKAGAGNTGENFSDVFQGGTDYFTHESASGDGNESANWKNFQSSEFGIARDTKMRLWMVLNVENTRNATIALGREVLKETAKQV